MVDDDGERLDWGHEDDEQQSPGSYSGYSPDQLGGYAGVPEDAEDAVSLGGDDEDEREYFANHSQEQGSAAPGAPSVAKTSSTASHPHPGKRDAQRLSATAPSRAPSRAKNSQSPSRESRPPNSSGKLPPAPLIHGLPPKPVLVPPLFEQPSEPGIRASAMVNNRPRKANGASKGLTAPDGGDPLPPDWEIRFPRNGGKDAYYYNVQTQESTWTRPRLPGSERASPTKNRENGSAQSSGRHSPEPQDDTWSQPTGRSQQARSTRRDPTSRRVSPPPNSDLSYDDRHYRPGEGPTSEGEDWRGTAGHPESTYGRGRSASPRPASDGRRGTRSSSPRWDRRARRELSQSPSPDREMWQESQRDYPQDRQAGVSDTGWIRSQEYPKPVQSAPRSSSTHRVRRKDDIESPVRRRKDDIEPTNRRKDDIEPRIRRKDDIEPPIRRKDDLGPRTRRKDDIEPPLRRKDDIEPPLRPLPSRETSSRHLNDEWQAPRPHSPPPHLREPSPPRRPGPLPSLPSSNSGYMGPASSSYREPSRYERPDSPPPGRYRDSNPIDNLPQRRGRDAELSDTGYDNSKRRRLNDDLGPPRRGPADLPAPVPSLPAKPVTSSYPPDTSEADQSHRKRAPLPPQHDHYWKNSQSGPATRPAPPTAAEIANLKLPIRIPSPERISEGNWLYTLPHGEQIKYCQINMMPPGYRGKGVMPVYDTPSGYISIISRWSYPEDHPKPTAIAKGPRVYFPSSQPSSSRGPRNFDAMNLDTHSSSRGLPASHANIPQRGMYSDRMPPPPADLPRAPRAMARDGSTYGPSQTTTATSPISPYDTRPMPLPAIDAPGSSSNRGRGRPGQPATERRWDERESFSGPNVVESPIHTTYQQLPPRDLPDRPSGRDVEPRGGPRGRPVDQGPPPRPPPGMSETNVIPIGLRPTTFDNAAPPSAPPLAPYQTMNNGYETRRQYGGERGGDPLDAYGKRVMRYPPSPEQPLSERPRTDRAGRRSSVTVTDSMRGRGNDDMVDDRSLPPSKDGATSRQSRFGPSERPPGASSDHEGRVWLTREDAQPHGPSRIDDDRGPRDMRENADPPRHVDSSRRYPSPPRGNGRGKWNNNQFEAPYSRVPPPLPPAHGEISMLNRGTTPPPPDRRFEEPPADRPVVKVHPDRARLFGAQAASSLPEPPARERSGKPNRRRGGGGSDRTREFEEDRARDLPPPPLPLTDDTRMGPPRARSPPPHQNGGARPYLKRGGSSLLERLNLVEESSSLRDRVDIVPPASVPPASVERAPTGRAEPMDVDAAGPAGQGGEDASKGGARGGGRRRNGKPRRGGRRGGGA